MAEVHRAGLEKSECEGLKRAAPMFQKAVEQLRAVRECEGRLLALAQNIENSAYYVRRHEVLSLDTDTLLKGMEALVQDVTDGFYPARACSMLNRGMTRLMANMELNARVEGVLSRYESRDGQASA